MEESQSITNTLLIEIDVLTNRIRNIRESLKTIQNKGLKERLYYENKNIFQRVNEIYRIAEFLSKTNSEKINFSNLLIEKTKRTLIENIYESNLFLF